MPELPSKLWRDLPMEKRVEVADAFWRDDRESDELDAQRVEAIIAIARRLNFRPKSVQALPIERRAKQLAHQPDVTDTIAARALIAYHMVAKRPMMAAFLDAVGIAHEDGIISAEEVPAPDPAKLKAGVKALQDGFPPDEVKLYLQTLTALDPQTWGELEKLF
jgi:hypothetical protein